MRRRDCHRDPCHPDHHAAPSRREVLNHIPTPTIPNQSQTPRRATSSRDPTAGQPRRGGCNTIAWKYRTTHFACSVIFIILRPSDGLLGDRLYSSCTYTAIPHYLIWSPCPRIVSGRKVTRERLPSRVRGRSSRNPFPKADTCLAPNSSLSPDHHMYHAGHTHTPFQRRLALPRCPVFFPRLRCMCSFFREGSGSPNASDRAATTYVGPLRLSGGQFRFCTSPSYAAKQGTVWTRRHDVSGVAFPASLSVLLTFFLGLVRVARRPKGCSCERR